MATLLLEINKLANPRSPFRFQAEVSSQCVAARCSPPNGERELKIAASLSTILFAGATRLGSEPHAQPNATNKHHWLGSCSVDWIYSSHNTGPNFTVKVSFHKNPTPTVRVLLAREDHQPDEHDWPVVASGETDSCGTARFFPIRPGNIKLASMGNSLLRLAKKLKSTTTMPPSLKSISYGPRRHMQLGPCEAGLP